MPNVKTSFGRRGEALARAHLVQSGYAIVTTNWRCSVGEIDIIAKDGDELVFVEVRTRHAQTTEWAWRSLTPHKQETMVATAQSYVNAYGQESAWRIDGIAIAVDAHDRVQIEHTRSVIDW